MSTPTDQFAQLTLESPLRSSDTEMAPAEEIRARALHLQDILSSFEETELPSEYQANIFNNIDQHMEEPAGLGSNHTIQGNLGGTLLQLGAYDDEAWAWMSTKLQSSDLRAQLYNEKVRRRFNSCFDAYDSLIDNRPTAATVKESLQPIISDFVKLSDGLSKDVIRRLSMDGQPPLFETQTLTGLLSALRKVCQSSEAIAPPVAESSRRSTRRTAPANSDNLSLFGILIRQADKDSPFLLEALEQFSGPSIKQCLEPLNALAALLKSSKAPEFYIARFEALKDKASDDVQPTASGTGGRGRGREADPKPGQKRPGQAAETAPKRGKRVGGR
ncbi:hypothetical protein OHC33_006256 [Knufia fluminis]|uniref:Uncharacterized protein n=1 Tax=Knufia fluminis TaxID=191047 RepID=A0AAN8ECY9_9EURO|nr:hypothetical protein OHC33_006256 [Knufia fluminis]